MNDTSFHASDADQTGPLPGFEAPAPHGSGYRVLARKYRPSSFADLIGQEAMVRTLSNAFEAGRIPQAWMLTGVRGVGKTTTARILARALNYEVDGGASGPTIHMPALGRHCQAIMESRHVDVMEMDAASHTGIDDVRQITDGVRYAPVSARTKVYIIDEVHMLSEKAFNAFLKTLEEPPPHAKFIFATTEIRKVPVTILSRCQRFDLRRVDTSVLATHLSAICSAESVDAAPEALAAIARAAEGSVRDALSILDQAIAHGAGRVAVETGRDMLGLADRAKIIDLFEAVIRGNLAESLAILREHYDAGADPAVVLSDLASFTHLVTRLKLVPDAAADPMLTEVERVRGAAFAADLSVRILSRMWQMLLKAMPEVQGAAHQLPAAEMVLVRLVYAADLPTPDEALRQLRNGEMNDGPSPSGGFPRSGGSGAPALAVRPTIVPQQTPPMVRSQPAVEAAIPEPALRFARFEDLVAYLGEKREMALKIALERDVRLVRFEDGKLEFALQPGAPRSLAADVGRFLEQATKRRWLVAVSSEDGEPTLRERETARKAARDSDAEGHPLVRAVMERFPGAKIVDIRERGVEAEAVDDGPPEAPLPDENDDTYDDEPPRSLDDD